MIESELVHNPRVTAGTRAGFEGFARFRSALYDPLATLLPIAVEVESVGPVDRDRIVAEFRARGFFVDDARAKHGVLGLAAALDRFHRLAAPAGPGDATHAPAGFRVVAAAIAHAVANRFRSEFSVPHRRGTLEFGGRPRVMAIVNVTPDSFSDGGRFADPDAAIEHALALEAAGADLIDVGAESTRPGAPPVSSEDEWARMQPVLRVLGARLRVPISVDTMKSEVAERAIDLGAAIVNDVSGLERDPRMVDVVARSGVAIIVSHAPGSAATLHEFPRYDDVVADVCRSLRERLLRAVAAGVDEERVVLDPGIGFGKRLEDNLDLLARVEELKSIGRPLLLGCSRKSFLGRITASRAGTESRPDARSAATAATTALAAIRGVGMVRVHDVTETLDVLKVLDAIDGRNRLA